MAEGIRIGVDVGGTFTDLVAWDPAGRMESCKVPTTPANPAEGVLHGIATLAPRTGAWASLAHGTTMVTNAIVERRGAPVGYITTRGFRDVLEIGRMSRLHLYRLDLPAKPEPLVPRRLRREITERVGPDGTVLTRLHLEELPAIVEDFKREGIESVAVCLLHSYASPAHEQALRMALEAHFPYVSISSEINAEFREYERGCTTALNASVMPLAARYLDDLVQRASGKPLHLLHSAGGMMSVEAAKERPLSMAMSGPAGGVAAAAHTSRALGLTRALAFDMGGTTTDVCLIADGVPETAGQRKLGDYPARLPMIAVESIGAGGGSIARVEPTGALKVGPRSAGAVPGPACYGQGGAEPTVSDANLLLGYLNSERIYGGSIRLDPARAESAIGPLAARFGFSLIEAAHGVVEVANANMLRALRLVSVQRGYDLRDFALIAYGGAGPLHAGALARQAGISSVIVPAHSGAFSALGCLVSPLRYDTVQTHRSRLETWDAKVVEERFSALEAQCLRPLLDEGHAVERIVLLRSLDLRYVGQNYELEIGFVPGGPGALRAAFEKRHRQLYGYATGENVECVNLRVTARAAEEPPPMPAPPSGTSAAATGSHRAYFPETGAVEMLRYDRASLPPGHLVEGPAMVEDDWSTTIVYPGMRCVADRLGNLVIEAGAPA
ncbi:MAG: hydantoin utilization protein [Candidatus Rokuibacteriota bacterium]|nr:MAG: hydantoin utilization protein [Candidatus Rokubacteria bacterium]PYM72239.1 MAG: hydantoin utilization protein [Candidatus Rokubacteria bacterium]